MAKTFFSKRSPQAVAVMKDAMDHVRNDLLRAEKQHGHPSIEIAEHLLILGFMHYLMGDYGDAEPLLLRYVAITKEKLEGNTREALVGLGLLFEIYVGLDCTEEIFRTGTDRGEHSFQKTRNASPRSSG